VVVANHYRPSINVITVLQLLAKIMYAKQYGVIAECAYMQRRTMWRTFSVVWRTVLPARVTRMTQSLSSWPTMPQNFGMIKLHDGSVLSHLPRPSLFLFSYPPPFPSLFLFFLHSTHVYTQKTAEYEKRYVHDADCLVTFTCLFFS